MSKLKTAFKVINEVSQSALTLIFGGAAGVVSAVGVLVINGFKCLTDNLHPIITVDASKLNLTEIINDITHHKGSFALPVKIDLEDENLAACIDPLQTGLIIGTGVAAGALVLKYAYACAKQREKSKQEEQDYLAINTSERKRNFCC